MRILIAGLVFSLAFVLAGCGGSGGGSGGGGSGGGSNPDPITHPSHPGWRYAYADLAATLSDTTDYRASAGVFEESWSTSIGDVSRGGYLRSGDVTGDGQLELVTVAGHTLRILNSAGQDVAPPVTLDSVGYEPVLEDVDGDGVLDILVGTRDTADVKIHVYSGSGQHQRTIIGRLGGFDSMLRPLALLGQDQLLTAYNAGFALDHRGPARFSLEGERAKEDWHFAVGPNIGPGGASIAQSAGQGPIMALHLGTPHNGATGRGIDGGGTQTRDSMLYTVLLDSNGNELFLESMDHGAKGRTNPVLVDLTGDGTLEVVTSLAHSSPHYPGDSQMRILRLDGSERARVSVGQSANQIFAVADLNGDGSHEIVVSNREDRVLRVFSPDLQLLRQRQDAGDAVLAVADLDGDGVGDILVRADDVLRILDGLTLAEKWALNVGDTIRTAITTDLAGDGLAEVYILSQDGRVSAFHSGGAGIRTEHVSFSLSAVQLDGLNLRSLADDGSPASQKSVSVDADTDSLVILADGRDNIVGFGISHGDGSGLTVDAISSAVGMAMLLPGGWEVHGIDPAQVEGLIRAAPSFPTLVARIRARYDGPGPWVLVEDTLIVEALVGVIHDVLSGARASSIEMHSAALRPLSSGKDATRPWIENGNTVRNPRFVPYGITAKDDVHGTLARPFTINGRSFGWNLNWIPVQPTEHTSAPFNMANGNICAVRFSPISNYFVAAMSAMTTGGVTLVADYSTLLNWLDNLSPDEFVYRSAQLNGIMSWQADLMMNIAKTIPGGSLIGGVGDYITDVQRGNAEITVVSAGLGVTEAGMKDLLGVMISELVENRDSANSTIRLAAEVFLGDGRQTAFFGGVAKFFGKLIAVPQYVTDIGFVSETLFAPEDACFRIDGSSVTSWDPLGPLDLIRPITGLACSDYGMCGVELSFRAGSLPSEVGIRVQWGDSAALGEMTLQECMNVGICTDLGDGRYRVWHRYHVGSYSGELQWKTAGGLQGVAPFSVTVDQIQNLPLQAQGGDRSVTLNWPALPADQYNLCRSETSVSSIDNCYVEGGRHIDLDIGLPPHLVAGLTNAQDYYFRLEGRFGNERILSDEVTATPTGEGVGSPGTHPLNDTGIDWCTDGLANFITCPVASFPGQDGEFGRDAAARAGTLPKVGTGDAGFDYTKISNNGAELPASATLGSGPNDWACSRDNVTGLIWEVKSTDGGLRDRNNTYTWYQPDGPNMGASGMQNGGNCVGSVCDTNGFVQAVNAQGLCDAMDWRLPTRGELHSIVHHGRTNPAVDTGFLPNTPGSLFWSASPYAGLSDNAWRVDFSSGVGFWSNGSDGNRVRLVRGGK